MNLYVISKLFHGVSGVYKMKLNGEEWEYEKDKRHMIRKVGEEWEYSMLVNDKYQVLSRHKAKNPYGVWYNESVYVFGISDDDPNIFYMKKD